jgi:hypothetical protein
LLAKTRPDEAELEGCGETTVESENEVWSGFHTSEEDLSLGTRGFRRNPKGRGRSCPFRRRASLQYVITVRSLLLELGKTGSRRRHPRSVSRPLAHLDWVTNFACDRHRESEPESGAVPEPAFDGDLATQRLHEPAHKSQAQAGATV